MEFTRTEKGARKLLNDGYIYIFQKNLANDLTSWECVDRRKGQCKARVKLTIMDEFVQQVNEHTHPPSQVKCEVAKVTASVKLRAETSNDTSRQILAGELIGISESASVNLPSMNAMRRNIRAARQDRNIPPQPVNIVAIPDIPQEYQITENGEQFLLFDSGSGDPERIIIFASPLGINQLATSEHWFADGTFKVCPEVFYQLYTVHAEQGGRIFPCVFALLPNKTEVTYTRFFREIFRVIDGNIPEDILCDFERAAMNGITNNQPQVDIKGCFYHLCANVWKHIQSLGLQPQYNADEDFALHLRMICALAFIPPNSVIDAFVEVCQCIRNNFNDIADDLIQYFEDTYIGRFRQNAPRRNPIFNIGLWNMYHRTDQELPRTNNSVEGWHRSFQGHLSACHPNFWRFLKVLKQEEVFNRTAILQHRGGHPVPAQRRRYANCNQRIIRIVDDYANRDTIDYLRTVAHNLSF